MTFTLVAGTRPNFIKIAALVHAIQDAVSSGTSITYRLVHTGQHFDVKMSQDFFDQLDIPKPHINLQIGGGSQAEQTAGIMVAFEQELINHRPDTVVVVGDVTSTMACAITAKKLNIDVIHVEAGIRSGDRSMPEEINRIVTDSITDHFFTTTKEASDHLLKSGIDSDKIHLVGNVMIDTLMANRSRFNLPKLAHMRLVPQQYFVLTLHRPSNVDNGAKLLSLLEGILKSTHLPVIFPVHPRTKKQLDELKFKHDQLLLIEPLPYLEFNGLVQSAKGVITDSGGITEEASVMNVPCVTLRNTTERPETITLGTNELIGNDLSKLQVAMQQIEKDNWKQYQGIPLWDGKASERIVKKLIEIYQ
ncbi:non-hydrolyzing UDP-N-acetylglucosamine 2-epimerase [Penaeicola halotolerans]|uniref:non-hydrolyzing UDP-N-acetylglucosamine 2-epimerase n=1 Tax=Penaeicola halotolerans TaxID=2793196 RepID=UPI001CF8BB83|nr:UDP-N-acetylglucosamine 2-epimerase (non-hydrolyzing) [Penaeicola halotolerans]